MNGPLVTIVIAAYNPLPRIVDAVRSALAQTVTTIEVLVIDDGSTVPVGPGLQEDPRLRIVRHEHNRGYGAATATALEHGRGEWFVWLDSDDSIAPDYCTLMLAAAEFTDADVVIGRLQHVDEHGNIREMEWQPPADRSSGQAAIEGVLRGRVPRGQHSLFSRHVLTDPPVVDNVYGDLIFMVRALARASTVAYVPEPLYDYFIHSGSITGSLRESVWDIAGLPSLLAPTLRENFPAPEADELIARARLLSLIMVLHTAAREPRATPLRQEVMAWCQSAIGGAEISLALRDRRWSIAGSLLLARVSPTIHHRLYQLYTERKELSA